MEPCNRHATKIYIIKSYFSNFAGLRLASTNTETESHSNWHPSWRVRVNSEKWMLALLRLAVGTHVSTRLPLNGFSWHLTLWTHTKISRENPNWLKSDKNIGHCILTPKCGQRHVAQHCRERDTLVLWQARPRTEQDGPESQTYPSLTSDLDGGG
jgi:hypothetical protein